jgi:FkbM family methyltransferase
MFSLAKSPIAPVLGQRVPLRGPARLLYRSYAKAHSQPGAANRRLTTKFGDEFDADFGSFLEWQLWAFGAYEEHFASLFRRLVKPGDRCIDVGANIGVHTVRLAKLAGPRGEVIAIEPDTELAERASNNIRLNQLQNVRVIRAAAAERSGDTVALYRPGASDPNKGRASLLAHSYLTGPAARVPTMSVDDIKAGPVALIKIDVEGHELAVVSGATATIEEFSPSVIFEYAPELIQGKSITPFDWFREKGYQLFSVDQDRNPVTGRGRLALKRLRTLPRKATNILAISLEMAPRLGSSVR